MHVPVPKLAISKAKEMGKRCQQRKPPQTLFALSLSGWHQELGSNPSCIHTKPRLAPKGKRDAVMRLKHSGETPPTLPQQDFPKSLVVAVRSGAGVSAAALWTLAQLQLTKGRLSALATPQGLGVCKQYLLREMIWARI